MPVSPSFVAMALESKTEGTMILRCGGRFYKSPSNGREKTIILREKECKMLTGDKGEASKAD